MIIILLINFEELNDRDKSFTAQHNSFFLHAFSSTILSSRALPEPYATAARLSPPPPRHSHGHLYHVLRRPTYPRNVPRQRSAANLPHRSTPPRPLLPGRARGTAGGLLPPPLAAVARRDEPLQLPRDPLDLVHVQQRHDRARLRRGEGLQLVPGRPALLLVLMLLLGDASSPAEVGLARGAAVVAGAVLVPRPRRGLRHRHLVGGR
ncbi:hypothetical protein Cni_G02685 [Canna indica]|uniref:Uncharacterized protein n=1 Tax=Canna indica TaxID=4628 RepID=A0AAQ3Q2K5_9LILI|nr:hypothetical protein Cni_G02685 [Canna indica]